jgi:hypothetical protein
MTGNVDRATKTTATRIDRPEFELSVAGVFVKRRMHQGDVGSAGKLRQLPNVTGNVLSSGIVTWRASRAGMKWELDQTHGERNPTLGSSKNRHKSLRIERSVRVANGA